MVDGQVDMTIHPMDKYPKPTLLARPKVQASIQNQMIAGGFIENAWLLKCKYELDAI